MDRRLLPLALGLALGAAATADAQKLLWTSPRGDLALPERPTADARSAELADDFEAWGDVAAITLDGLACASCDPMPLAAVEVRIWSWRAGLGPGELEAEYRLEANEIAVDPERPGKIGVRLANPFAARGRHFLSARLEFATTGVWSWWSAAGEPRLSSAWQRDSEQSWSPLTVVPGLGVDLAFELTASPWDERGLARGCGQLEVEAPPAPEGGVAWRLVDVAAVDAERAWAVGMADLAAGARALLFEREGGRWQALVAPLPEGTRLATVEAVSEKEIWFAGSAPYAAGPLPETRQPLALRYFPGEARWELLPTPVYLDGDAELADLVATGREGVWAVGSAVVPEWGSPARVGLVLRWNGTAFERVPVSGEASPAGEGLAAIAADGDEIWAVGGGGEGGFVQNLLVGRWNGRELERLDVPGLDRVERLAAVAVGGREVWLGGTTGAGEAVLSHYDGLSWQGHPSPLGGAALADDPKGFVTAGAGLASFVDGKWHAEPGDAAVALTALAAPRPCALFAAGALEASSGERGLVLRLAPRGFADGFESGGFEAWSTAP